MEHLIHECAAYLAAKGYKERGIAKILHALRQYFRYAAEHNLDICHVTITDAEKYREYLRSHTHRGTLYSAATVNSKLSSVRCLYRYLVGRHLLLTNPFAAVGDLKRGTALVKGMLKQEDMEHLLHSFPRTNRYDATICIILELLYATGMRIGEVAALRVEDVDCDRGFVRVRDDKARQDRVCVLTEYAAALVNVYITTVKPTGLVFEHFATGRALRGAVGNKLKSVTKKLKLAHISCHSFRHSMATHMLENGADIRQVQELLGHKHIRQTERYTRVTPEALKAVVRTCHPREASGVSGA